MAPIRSWASVRHRPRGKSTPGMAAVREGPPSSTSNTIIRKLNTHKKEKGRRLQKKSKNA
jgi:hypothetical protein